MANKKVNMTIGIDYDVNKQGLAELKKQLEQIRIEAEQAKLSGTLIKNLEKAYDAALKLENVLSNAYNTKTSQFNLSQVNKRYKRYVSVMYRIYRNLLLMLEQQVQNFILILQVA